MSVRERPTKTVDELIDDMVAYRIANLVRTNRADTLQREGVDPKVVLNWRTRAEYSMRAYDQTREDVKHMLLYNTPRSS